MRGSLPYILSASLLIASVPTAGQTRRNNNELFDEWRELQTSFRTKRARNQLDGAIWSLIHSDAPKKEIELLLQLVGRIYEPLQIKRSRRATDIKSTQQLKDSFAQFLSSADDTVVGFAATMLGICKDVSYAPSLAKLLNKPDPEGDAFPISSRGRAAMALAELGSKEYIPNLALLLKSANRYDRNGAAIALGELGAKNQAQDIADLLTAAEFRYEDNSSAVYALMQMGVGSDFAELFAKKTHDEFFSSETVKAAAYALAQLGAIQYADDIGKLLLRKYQQGDAAKALAIMGAKQYADDISKLLGDESSLTRSDALIALGVMGEKRFIPQIAKHLKDVPGSSEDIAAAEALVLLDANKYAQQVTSLLARAFQNDAYLGTYDFHPLVEVKLMGIRRQFRSSFLRMRRTLARQKLR